MVRLYLKFLISTIILGGVVAGVQIYLNNRPRMPITNKDVSHDSSRSFSIDIIFNPEITTQKLKLRAYNSTTDLYDAYDIRKRYSNIQSDSAILTKIPEYLNDSKASELNDTTVKNFQDINAQWHSIVTDDKPTMDLVIHESFKNDDKLFSIGTELHAFTQDFMRRKKLPLQYVDQIDKQFNDNYYQRASQASTPKLMALIKRLVNAYTMPMPDVELALTTSTSISVDFTLTHANKVASAENRLTIGVFSFMHFTDDEMEVVLAHELAHLRSQHARQSEDLETCSGTKKVKSNFSCALDRSQEREADTLALTMTKKPEAHISGLLKLARLSFMGMMNGGQSHPTIHERIMFGLAKMDIVGA